ncbi:9073_t:CDS:2, partial [Ambispora leptoticha]
MFRKIILILFLLTFWTSLLIVVNAQSSSTSTNPPGRYGHCSFTWKNNFYVFGGWDNSTDSDGKNQSPFFYYTTLPITNTDKITWTYLSTENATSVGSAACVVTPSDYLLVLGGILTLKSSENKISTQVFDLNKGVWINWSSRNLLNAYPGYGVTPKATLISPNFVVVYAGDSGVNENGKNSPSQYFYFLNMTSSPWTWSQVTKNEDLVAPISRIMVTVKGSAWMIGGYFNATDSTNNLYSNRIYISNRRYQWISPDNALLTYGVRDGAVGIRNNMLYLIAYSGNADNPVTYGGCPLLDTVIQCATPINTIQIFNMTSRNWTAAHNIVTNVPINNFTLPLINGLDLNAENDDTDANTGSSDQNSTIPSQTSSNNSNTKETESQIPVWLIVFISCIVTGLICVVVIFFIVRCCKRRSDEARFEITRNRQIEIAVSKDEGKTTQTYSNAFNNNNNNVKPKIVVNGAGSPARQWSASEKSSSLVVEAFDRSRSITISDDNNHINDGDEINFNVDINNDENLTPQQRQWIRSVLSIPDSRTSNSHSRETRSRPSTSEIGNMPSSINEQDDNTDNLPSQTQSFENWNSNRTLSEIGGRPPTFDIPKRPHVLWQEVETGTSVIDSSGKNRCRSVCSRLKYVKAAAKFGLNKSQVGRWVNQLDAVGNKKSCRSGCGRKEFFPEEEARLYAWVTEMRRAALAVTYSSLKLEMSKIVSETTASTEDPIKNKLHVTSKHHQHGGQQKEPALLVFDSFKGHLIDTVKKEIKKHNTNLAVCQPLDVSINRPFKVALCRHWHAWMAGNNAKKNQIIRRAFLMDGSEDDEIYCDEIYTFNEDEDENEDSESEEDIDDN